MGTRAGLGAGFAAPWSFRRQVLGRSYEDWQRRRPPRLLERLRDVRTFLSARANTLGSTDISDSQFAHCKQRRHNNKNHDAQELRTDIHYHRYGVETKGQREYR